VLVTLKRAKTMMKVMVVAMSKIVSWLLTASGLWTYHLYLLALRDVYITGRCQFTQEARLGFRVMYS